MKRDVAFDSTPRSPISGRGQAATAWSLPTAGPSPALADRCARRSGAEWFSEQCKKLGIALINNQVDIGVRVELPALVFEHIPTRFTSPSWFTGPSSTATRCALLHESLRHVVAENVEGINTVNGHSYSDPALRSENTNFALLVSNRFTQPFDQPYDTASTLPRCPTCWPAASWCSALATWSKGVRTNEHRSPSPPPAPP